MRCSPSGIGSARHATVIAGAVLVSAIGCAPRYGPGDNPTMLRDASGAEFGWRCDDAGCRIESVPGTPPLNPCGDPGAAAWSYAWGRFVELCSVCVFAPPARGWSATGGDCRLVACDADEHCPTMFFRDPQAHYVCVNGLCQNDDVTGFPRDLFGRHEVESLCFAEVPRDETTTIFSPRSMEISAIAQAACPDPSATCEVPPTCRAP